MWMCSSLFFLCNKFIQIWLCGKYLGSGNISQQQLILFKSRGGMFEEWRWDKGSGVKADAKNLPAAHLVSVPQVVASTGALFLLYWCLTLIVIISCTVSEKQDDTEIHYVHCWGWPRSPEYAFWLWSELQSNSTKKNECQISDSSLLSYVESGNMT